MRPAIKKGTYCLDTSLVRTERETQLDQELAFMPWSLFCLFMREP
jgi:hypothetical protein